MEKINEEGNGILAIYSAEKFEIVISTDEFPPSISGFMIKFSDLHDKI